MSQKRVKVVMVGPVSGRLRLLSDKLRRLQKSKAGPFDVCLCAGPFFYQATADDTGVGVGSSERSEKDVEKNSSDDEDNDKLVHQMELELWKETAMKDGDDLVNGSLTFDIPVLFMDAGDGFPEGINVSNPLVDALKNNDEIDIDSDDDDGEEEEEEEENCDEDMNNDENEANDSGEQHDSVKTPNGLLRIAHNLYQLVGDARQQRKILGSCADIVSVPIPLTDPQQSTAGNGVAQRNSEHATSITIGFVGSKIRLPCKSFEEKCTHASFLGCDVLISGDWGHGIASTKGGALTADDQSVIGAVGGKRNNLGSHAVAELVAMSRPRYHVAPGPIIPVQIGEESQLQRRFVASLPYCYPATSETTMKGSTHAGRFLAMGSVLPPLESKALGKSFKFIHALGIIPLSDMDDNERDAAKESYCVVDFPYRDALTGRARRSVRLDGTLDPRDRQQCHQYQPRKRTWDGEDGPGFGNNVNVSNQQPFLEGFHRDRGITLTPDKLMDAFTRFIGVCFPDPKMDNRTHDNEIHLRQTKRTKPNARGSNGKPKPAHGNCRIKGCTKSTTYVCNSCTHPSDVTQKQVWICDPFKSPGCFDAHKVQVHSQELNTMSHIADGNIDTNARAAEDEVHLRQTKRTKPNAKGVNGKPKIAQGNCRIKGCTRSTSYVCNSCTDPMDLTQKQIWICNPLKSPGCFEAHMTEVHNKMRSDE